MEPGVPSGAGVDAAALDQDLAVQSCSTAVDAKTTDMVSRYRLGRGYLARANSAKRQGDDIASALFMYQSVVNYAAVEKYGLSPAAAKWYVEAAGVHVVPSAYLAAAEQGNLNAQVALGLLYVGWHRPLSFNRTQRGGEQARTWMRMAAEQGDASAQYYVAEILKTTTTSSKDKASIAEAFKWYSAAYAQGHIPAGLNVGSAYLYGIGVEADVAKGIRILEEFAVDGSTAAQERLGQLYKDGIAIIQDFELARYWYEMAAAAGSHEAAYNLSRLPPSAQQIAEEKEKRVQALLASVKIEDESGIGANPSEPSAQDIAHFVVLRADAANTQLKQIIETCKDLDTNSRDPAVVVAAALCIPYSFIALLENKAGENPDFEARVNQMTKKNCRTEIPDIRFVCYFTNDISLHFVNGGLATTDILAVFKQFLGSELAGGGVIDARFERTSEGGRTWSVTWGDLN